MPRYDQYNLANSRQVKPFAGSVLPELTSVAGTLQERFDKALENEDLLNRMVRNSQAGPFEKDQQLLGTIKQQFRGRINERSARGDYENMYRDTMLDARNFVDQYKPIVENAQRYEEYKNSLSQAVAKGDIKSPDKARRLLALSTQAYQGLSYDPSTGTVSNRFSGLTPVKDIDPTEKIDKWMKDLAPTVIGKEVKYTDGVWMKYQEGKWTTLKSDEIQRVMNAGRRLDPEFDAWLQQEKQLSVADYGHVTDKTIQDMKDGPLKQSIMQEAARTGTAPTTIFRDLLAKDKEQNILHNMIGYANKYIRDDQQAGSGITGADPYNLERTKKKLEDEALVLAMPILQPEARMEIKGAEDMLGKISQAGTAVQSARQNFDNWVQTNQLRPDGKGNWVDAQGNDKTLKYLEQKQVLEQAQHAWQNLQKLDAEANRRSGYGQGTVTPELMKKADQYADKQVQAMQQPGGPGGAPASLSTEAISRARQNAKAQYLRQNSPGYAQKDQFIRDMTTRGAQAINVQTFNSKSANEQATNLFKGLVLNLDASGLKSGTQGLKWASGDAAGEDLEAGDYKKVAQDAVFAGYAMDTDGQLKYYYKVGQVKTNAKGKSVGEEALVKMPALPGTTEILLKNKQTDLAQLGLGQRINETMNNASGTGYIDVGGGKQVYIDRIDKSEIGTSEVGAGINLRFPAADGTYTEVRVNSVGDAINTITGTLQRAAARQKQ